MMKTTMLKDELLQGVYDDLLKDIYIDSSMIEYHKNRYILALEKYEKLYGMDEVCVFSAPGRSEVGGNHTDHQHGEILATAINLDAIAVVSKTKDSIIRLVSDGFDEIEVDLCDTEIKDEEKETTLSLIKGVVAGVKNRGYKVGGFNAYVTSDVLIGAGLSSSAAFETVIGTIISHLYNDGLIDATTIAIIGQYAENVYFGKPCGLMDQMACSVGNLVHVDFGRPDCPIVEKVDFDINEHGYSLCITDTKGSHADLTADYAAVPEEMKKIANYFGKEVLKGLSFGDIMNNISELRKQCGDRAVLRAIHFITENDRVGQEVEALKNNDIETFLSLVDKSGDSSFKYLQNVYTNKEINHQNMSLALAISDVILSDGSGVCRVHGGGFAGTIQAFVKNDKVEEYSREMNRVFGQGACKALKIRKYGGMKVMG